MRYWKKNMRQKTKDTKKVLEIKKYKNSKIDIAVI